MDAYIFLSISNQSGSNALYSLLSQCQNCIGFDEGLLPVEGQSIAGEAGGMINPVHHKCALTWTKILDKIQDPSTYNWKRTKNSWHDAWRQNPKYNNRNRVFIEKSPPNPARLRLLQDNFPNTYFILQVRNPYAVCEGIYRRYKNDDVHSPDIRVAAQHVIKVMEIQKWNLENIDNVVGWRYEDLVKREKFIEDIVRAFIPSLHDFSLSKKLYANTLDGYKEQELLNYNDRQINNLSEKQIRIINDELKGKESLMEFFGYEQKNI